VIALERLGPACHPADTIVAVQAGRRRSWTEFCAEVGGCSTLLADCGRVVLYCRDSWNFAVRLFGALSAGAEVVLPANGLPATLARLDGALVDDAFVVAEGAWTQPLPAHGRVVFHTSGSTGAAKAIVRSLAQLAAEVAAVHGLWGEAVRGAATLATVPHQHAFGLVFKVLWPLAAGRPFHTEQHELWEDVLAALPAGAVLVTSPAHLTRMGGLSPLPAERRPRLVLSAGAPLPAEAAADARLVLGIPVTEIYGSSETGAIATRCDAPAWSPLPGYHVSRTADGLLRLESPAASAEVADRIEPAAGGGFHLLGRADRVAKIEGKRVSLDEVELALAELPDIHSAAAMVLDEAHPVLGAVAVLTAAGQARLDDQGAFRFVRALRRALSDRLEPAALPRRMRFVAQLPRGAMGKCPAADLAALFGEPPRLPAILDLRTPEDGLAELDLRIPADLFWFQGHFPGRPVLPGVVQIDWAVEFARRHLGLDLPAAREFQIKFKAVVEPEDRLVLALRHDPTKGRLGFSYRRGEQECSSGTVFL
jgi:acyl-coenzyme A synthetase/AMP-(fatty) acid ligase